MTWIPLPAESGFGLDHLPYGIFQSGTHDRARAGVRVGDHVLDVSGIDPTLALPTLDAFLRLGRSGWQRVREAIVDLAGDDARADDRLLCPVAEATMSMPFTVADYVDFYASEHHATNLGRMFRPGQEPLLPNWKHLPVGYHGRAGTVVVSGTPVVRPCGQLKPSDGPPVFAASRRLDIEAELGFVVGVGSRLGERVAIDSFADHVFGMCLVNDWSARDIQSWEYVPLGPFLGKSFATSISPWITPLAALERARVAPPARAPEPLPYLDDRNAKWGLDITFEVRLNGSLISRPPFRDMYWTAPQQLAHMTANGAMLRTGDLFASGTVSGSASDERGSLIELSWNGAEPISIAGGTRTFLEDGDEVTISASAPAGTGARIALGDVSGTITPASC